MRCKFGIIADDFTGSNDVGVQFAKKGLKTLVITRLADVYRTVQETDVLVIDTESRALTEDQSYHKVSEVAKACKKAGIQSIYKKIDSTLRGNIGSELMAVKDIYDPFLVVVVPAYPKNGRITIGGFHLLDKTPIGESEIAYDPEFPNGESHVPTIIQRQTRLKVGHINLSIVTKGAQFLHKEILKRRELGDQILVLDAVTQNNLKTIADAIAAIKIPCLCSGSAGLAEEIPDAFGLTKEQRRSVLFIVGSLSSVTFNQILRLNNLFNPLIIEFDVKQILNGEESRIDEINKIMKNVQQAFGEGRDAVICLARSDESLKNLWNFFEKYSFRKEEIIEISLYSLGEITSKLLDDVRVNGLVLTGGDTSMRVLNALGVVKTEVVKEILPGIPLIKIVGGKYDGRFVVTKAGAFGHEYALIEVLNYLKEM
jgi:uncharacterized protein YgbK (DUF1537 family)